MSCREAGRRGGEATAARHGRSRYEAIGQRGGAAVLARYGVGFFRWLGRRSARLAERRRDEVRPRRTEQGR
ncbi:MAG TPA: general stress protein [Chloroflexota bacterium]|nr:general stress protein [Chloroflexota bacterium]